MPKQEQQMMLEAWKARYPKDTKNMAFMMNCLVVAIIISIIWAIYLLVK